MLKAIVHKESIPEDPRIIFESGNGEPRKATLYTACRQGWSGGPWGRELGAAYQRECLVSWRRLGFDIVSLNSRAEIEALSPLGYELSFREAGEGLPSINDFIRIIKEDPSPVAGIINADCMMAANGQVMSVVMEAARARACFAADARATGQGCYGFDLFLFAKQHMNGLKFPPEITIGVPWWDYWFAVAYHLAGGQLFAAPAPMLVHLDHPQGWSRKTWLAIGRQMPPPSPDPGPRPVRFRSSSPAGPMDFRTVKSTASPPMYFNG